MAALAVKTFRAADSIHGVQAELTRSQGELDALTRKDKAARQKVKEAEEARERAQEAADEIEAKLLAATEAHELWWRNAQSLASCARNRATATPCRWTPRASPSLNLPLWRLPSSKRPKRSWARSTL